MGFGKREGLKEREMGRKRGGHEATAASQCESKRVGKRVMNGGMIGKGDLVMISGGEERRGEERTFHRIASTHPTMKNFSDFDSSTLPIYVHIISLCPPCPP